MNYRQIVIKLEEEIKGKNRKETISGYEEILTEHIEELSTYQNFFNLPLVNIFSVISKVDFYEIEDDEDKILEIIQNIIKNAISKHPKEKESILILQYIDKNIISSLAYDEIFSILDLIKNCLILSRFCDLHKEKERFVEKDYSYEISEKNKEIEKLKQVIKIHSPKETIEYKKEIIVPIKPKPKAYEQNIFIACKEGDLESVQWLIETRHVDPNIRAERDYKGYEIYEDNVPIHIAARNGHLSILGFLITHGANIEARNHNGGTALHYACCYNHLQIVKDLLSQKANIEAKDSDGVTPLHDACSHGHFDIVEYLISKRANIDARERRNWTPLHFASINGNIEVVKYLVSRGANKYVRDISGKTPLDYTDNDEIRRILL